MQIPPPGGRVIEASLHEHIHVLDVVVAAGGGLEQEDILVADQPDRQSIRAEERLAALLHPVGEHELVHDLLGQRPRVQWHGARQ